MGKKSPAPPPAPDYAAAATAQGAANLDAARLTARLSNPNISTPLGGQRVTFGKSTFDEAGYNKAMEDYNKQLAAYNAQGPQEYQGYEGPTDISGGFLGGGYRGGQFNPAPVAPTREQFTTITDKDTPYIEQYLTPEAQKTLEAQQRVDLALAGLGEQGIGVARDVLGQRFNPNLRDLQTQLGGYGQVAQGPNLLGMGQAGANVSPQEILSNVRAGRVNRGPLEGQYGFAQGNLSPTGVNYGPREGQYGMAQGDLSPTAINYGPREGQYGMAQGGVQGPQLQSRLDLSGLPQAPISAGTTAQQAIMGRLQPQLERQRAQLQTQLANQGITPGSEAYNTAMTEQSQRENDLMSQAALQGINLDQTARAQAFGEQQAAGQFANQAALSGFGANVQNQQLYNQAVQQNLQQGLSIQDAQNRASQQLFGQRASSQQAYNQAVQQNLQQGLSIQDAQNRASQQLFGQRASSQQAYNQAVQQNLQQGLSIQDAQNRAAQQLFGQQLSAQEAANQAAQARFGQQMDIQGLYNTALAQNQNAALQQQAAANAAQAQQFNQALQAGQFGNTALQQSLAQQLALRNQPLNEIAALMSGSQVQMPQFQGYTGANVGAAPVFGAAQAQDAAAMNRYGIQANQQASNLGGLFGLGASILGGPAGGVASQLFNKFSDRRLKSNIERVGTHPLGIGVYEYDIAGRRERGVMADEVQSVKPEAVSTHESGYKMVNYGML